VEPPRRLGHLQTAAGVAWSSGRPAYRCRHGYASAASPDPARPKNTYVREDQILPHLAAMAILLADGDHAISGGITQITAPDQTAGLIDQLRTTGVTLTYDPDTQTIRGGDSRPLAVTVATGR
jgi:site-specific DNA recombinase